jgi:sugar phosphate isomerase/epimerase
MSLRESAPAPAAPATTPHPRLSINQATIKYAPLATALELLSNAGVRSIGIWREEIAQHGLSEVSRMVADSGLRVSSLCRGGFFTTSDPAARSAALDENRRAIAETAALRDAGAPGSAAVLVLVAGGLPDGSRDLVGARERVRDAIDLLEPDARAAGVTLAIEALHPMYVADRAVVSTLAQALDIAEHFPSASVGVVVDTFHLWWDPDVYNQIERAGAGDRIASYQVCDFLTPLPADVLLGRGMMGDGHVDFRRMTQAVTDAGYRGDVEVEIFNQEVWDGDPAEVIAQTVRRFAEHVPLP